MESNKLTNVIIDGEYDAFEWGWYVEPDPDSMLAYLICDQRGGLERLVVVQRGVRRALRAAERRDRRRDAPGPRQADAGASTTTTRRTWSRPTPRSPRPYRSDRWACLQPQPDPGGILLIQYGIRNYLEIRPADEAGDCDGVATALGASGSSSAGGGGGAEDDGSNTAVLVVGGVLLAALVVGGGVLAMRRRATAADRE